MESKKKTVKKRAPRKKKAPVATPKPASLKVDIENIKPLDLHGIKGQPLDKDILAFTTPKILGLINHLAGLGKTYLEVGTYRGVTLATAAHGNETQCTGIDSYQWPGRTAQRNESDARERIKPFAGRVRLKKGNHLSILRTLNYPVDCFFYDGPSQEAAKALELILPRLSDNAYIILDDADKEEVRKASAAFCEKYRYSLVFEKLTGRALNQNPDPIWWRGIQILKKN